MFSTHISGHYIRLLPRSRLGSFLSEDTLSKGRLETSSLGGLADDHSSCSRKLTWVPSTFVCCSNSAYKSNKKVLFWLKYLVRLLLSKSHRFFIQIIWFVFERWLSYSIPWIRPSRLIVAFPRSPNAFYVSCHGSSSSPTSSFWWRGSPRRPEEAVQCYWFVLLFQG